jgi:diketogulonate reductase-like aldo/keto reductase
VHWPVAGKYVDTWRALEHLYRDGRIRAIGVSNFLRHHLEDLLQSTEIVPMVNQMEFHPFLVQQELLDFCKRKKIQYEAWSPLMQGNIFDLPALEELAKKYERTIAQVVLRWDLQKGVVTIPKSSRKERIISNSRIFDFKLSEADMKLLDALDRGQRFGPNPDNFDF